ncbi:hypothetical protein ORM77_16125 [Bacillus cereus]|uniref:hypothetical protein n=1 Tax=Bacillus cereus TaxID=1396 RepID=UPI002AC04781|nr:hypothetical protein [Bacillus cereus]MDZ4619396.1 hypothetical protein [Bacillus cereus]
MFNKEKLQDKLGYEIWVLKKCNSTLHHFLGMRSSRTISFLQNGTQQHGLLESDKLGANNSMETIQNLSPLLFVTSYKCLDMIFEWILEGNNRKVPSNYKQKIKELKSRLNLLKLPMELESNKNVINIFLNLYSELRHYRNKIIHGGWGKNVNGDLNFNFKGNNTIDRIITFKEVIEFGESVRLLSELLIEGKYISPLLDTIKFLLDKLTNLHQSNKFNILSPSLFHIIYEIGNKQQINLNEIRKDLKIESEGSPFYFSLTIISEDEEWILPTDYLANRQEILIDSSIQQFKI